jgi:hypothetical protein
MEGDMRGDAARFQSDRSGAAIVGMTNPKFSEGADMNLDFSSLQGVMVIIGPIVLAAVLLWALLNNRTSAKQKRRTEDATKRVRDEQNREDVLREP